MCVPIYVREWTLAQRTYDDFGRHMAHETSAPMDIGQVRDVKGKGKQGNGKQGKGKEKGKRKKDNCEAKGHAKTDDPYFSGACGYCCKWGHKKAPCRYPKGDQGDSREARESRHVIHVT